MRILNKQAVVLISGKAGVGKTTLANYLVSQLQGNHGGGVYSANKHSFATKLKEIAISGGWDGLKNVPGRQLLIDVGKAFRDYDLDTWAKLCYNGIDVNDDVAVIDDWRFINEHAFFKSLDPEEIVLFTVRVKAPSREALKGSVQYQDYSEISLDHLEDSFFDFVVGNEGNIDELMSVSKDIVLTIEKQVGFW